MKNLVLIAIVFAMTAILYGLFGGSEDHIVADDAVKIIYTSPSVSSVKLKEPKEISSEEEQSQIVKPFNEKDSSVVADIKAFYNTGNFLRALELADTYLKQPIDEKLREWLQGQQLPLRISAGWSELKLGRCEVATELFLLTLETKRTKEAAKGLAYCQMKVGDYIRAEYNLLWLIDNKANDSDVYLLYGDIVETTGQFVDGITTIEQSLDELTEGKEAVEQKLEDLRRKAKEGMQQQEISSKFFLLRYHDQKHNDIANLVMEALESTMYEFVETYEFREPRSPIEVILYPAANFKQVVVGSPNWADGIFDGRIRIPVRNQVRFDIGLRRVLRHELVHAMFSQMSDARMLPTWVEEGVAQRLACGNDCGDFDFGPMPGSFLDQESFEKRFIQLNSSQAQRAYTQSLYMIYVMEHEYRQEVPLKKLISSVNHRSGLSSDDVLDPIGIRFKQLWSLSKERWDKRIRYSVIRYE